MLVEAVLKKLLKIISGSSTYANLHYCKLKYLIIRAKLCYNFKNKQSQNKKKYQVYNSYQRGKYEYMTSVCSGLQAPRTKFYQLRPHILPNRASYFCYWQLYLLYIVSLCIPVQPSPTLIC